MIRPPPLQRGDVVRVVAPAGPFEPECFENGLEILRSRFGLVPRFRDDITARWRYLAGEDSRRREEWLEAIGDRDARAVWCARGGYGAMRLLPQLDASPLIRDPKWFAGFSDITVLHTVLNQAGLVTLHGPNITGLGRLPPEGLDHLEALLFGNPEYGVIGTGVIRPGSARGPLLGGSLTLLAHLCGTRWQPQLTGAVLFIEDVGEKPYRLDRYFTQLRLAGALDGVAAVAIGQLTECTNGETQGTEVLRELVYSLEVPTIEGIAAGHEAMNLALPLGSSVTVTAPGPGEGGAPQLVFDPGPVP